MHFSASADPPVTAAYVNWSFEMFGAVTDCLHETRITYPQRSETGQRVDLGAC